MTTNNWFECKVTAEHQTEGQLTKTFNETYLIDALNCTAAEQRILQEITPYCHTQPTITSIRHIHIHELIPSQDENADRWYKARINLFTLDEKTSKEKKTTATIIIQATDLPDALSNLQKAMKGTMLDWQTSLLQETNILDVFPYTPQTTPQP